MSQIENAQRATRRQACTGPLTSGRHRGQATGPHQQRSLRSKVRSTDALINEYTRDVATERFGPELDVRPSGP